MLFYPDGFPVDGICPLTVGALYFSIIAEEFQYLSTLAWFLVRTHGYTSMRCGAQPSLNALLQLGHFTWVLDLESAWNLMTVPQVHFRV